MRNSRRGAVTGESFAQVNNPDPFAPPVWRSPVYRTPEIVIWLVQLARLLARLIWFVISHPLLDMTAGLIVLDYLNLGWPGLAATAGLIVPVLVLIRLAWPGWFARFVTQLARDAWRYWRYRRRWHAVMAITGLSPLYEGRVLVPVLAGVAAGSAVDKVTVQLVSGQSPADFADRAEGIAHGLGVHLCRVRPAAPGLIVLELVRRDALAEPIPALPVPQEIDPAALPVGRCEDGTPWLLRLLGTHVLIAGATGAGKGSVIWSLIRALLPGICTGWVRVWACDPKRMELSFGRDLFARYADQATAMVELVEAAVVEMHARAASFDPGGLFATGRARCSIRAVLMAMILPAVVPSPRPGRRMGTSCRCSLPPGRSRIRKLPRRLRPCTVPGRRNGRWRWRSGTGWASGWPMRISRSRSGSGAGRAGRRRGWRW